MLILLKRLGRGIGGSSAPHLIDTYDHDGTEMPKHGARLGDVFDCVNKPQYHCPDKVDRAGAKCSLCHVRIDKRSVLGAHFLFFLQV